MYKQISIKKKNINNEQKEKQNIKKSINILPKMIKKENIIYSLRTVFIVLSESFPVFQNQQSFNIYYPISKINHIENKYSLPKPSNNELLINNLSDICCEVCKLIDLDIEQHSYKLNIYNQNYNLISSDEQLTEIKNKNNILYVKVSKFNTNEEIKNFDRCENHKNPRPRFFNTSNNFFRLSHKQFFKSRQNRFNERKFLTQKKFHINNIDSNSNLNNDIFPKIKPRKNLKKATYTSIDSETNKGDFDFSDIIKNLPQTHSRINSITSIKIHSPKIIHNLYKNNDFNSKIKNVIMTPNEVGIISPRKRSEYKEVKKEKFFQSARLNIHHNLTEVHEDIINNYDDFEILQNKKLLHEINEKITDFTINKINNFISNKEIDNFKNLDFNYDLINEKELFPLIKLKKQFIFYSYLSEFLIKKQVQFCKDFYKLCKSNKYDNLSFMLNIRNFSIVIDDIFEEFNIIINNKKEFLFKMKSIEKISISYIFIIIFIFIHNDLCFMTDKDLVFLLLKSMKINFGSSLDFQKFCNYLMSITRNKFMIFDGKFLFVQRFVNNIFLHKNSHDLLKKSTNYFSITNKDLKIFIDNDIKKIKMEKNINLIQKIEEIYYKIIDYYTY